MHIPDGFLSTPVWLSLDAAGVPLIGYLARRAQRELEESRVPLLGVMGAFVFAAQMINFPVGIGTSGHLLGAALLAITLGPAAASIVMTAILAIQALVFQDGGVLALGANVLNMAVLGVAAGYLPYRLWGAGRFRKAAIFLGGAGSVVAGAVLAMAELLLSGVRMPLPIVWVSLGLFAITGALEGAITLAVVQGVEALNPGFVQRPAGTRPVTLGIVALAAVLLAALGILLACGYPDGLAKLAQDLGIETRARSLFSTPLADYSFRQLGSSWFSRAAAGLVGLGLIYVLCLLAGRWISRRRSA
jgi:cobalt/nickel transport system permease protein